MKKEYLECGKVTNAHGVRGILKVESWCDSPKILAERKRVFFRLKSGEYEQRAILSASVSGQGLLMGIEGISTREDAIACKNEILYLKREDIPVPKGAMLIQDIIGLPVIDADNGRVYGRVKSAFQGVRGMLYTIETPTGEVLYPSAPGFIKEVSAEGGMLICPIPGFFEEV